MLFARLEMTGAAKPLVRTKWVNYNHSKLDEIYVELGQSRGSISKVSFLQFQTTYNVEATTLHHSRELAGLKPPWCTFNPISHISFADF